MILERRWTRGAEIGVLKGDTYLYLLENCPLLTLVGVDLWEASPDYEAVVRSGAAAYAERALIVKADTVQAATQFDDRSFDFAFIDADHREAAVRADISAWRPKIRPGGWLMGHDYDHKRFPGVKIAVDDVFGAPKTFPDHVWAVEIPA